MKRKHLLPAGQSRRGTATGTGALYPTGGAALRLERLSATTASTTWYDITGNGKNGTANSASLFSDFLFNGTNSTVATTLESPLLPATSTWTLQAWVTQLANGRTLFATRAGNNGWALRDSPSGGDLEFTSFPFAGNLAVLPSMLGGDWYHIVLAWAPGAPASLKSYVNGALHATVAPSDYAAVGQPLVIGSGTAGFYNGKIDTVRVYSRALSADEILRDYNAGKPEHP
tara:strand:+ start:10445 stop:11131 length:687 start_codon:yes stop_codon:yes gene_type:complete